VNKDILYTSLVEHTYLMQSHRQWPWRGWAISILLFTIIIVFTTPPPESDYNSSSSSSNSNAASSSAIHTKAPTEERHDVIVKCELSTPFAPSSMNSAKGTLTINVHRWLAPKASNAFIRMVSTKHFDHTFVFRVIKGFIVQFGIESPITGEEEKKPRKFLKVDLDPLPTSADELRIRSNARGALNFAGGNSGSGQVYINRGTNAHLDKEPGSLPFATLDEDSMRIIDQISNIYKEGMGQVKAVKKGDEEIKKLFPNMSKIERCWIDDA